MKRIIALSLSVLMLLLCLASCDTSQDGESSVPVESNNENSAESKDETSADSSMDDISDTSSETNQPSVDELNIIYYKFEIPMFDSNVPEKGASCVDYDGKGIDEYLLERDDASDDIYFAVGLRVSEGATIDALTEKGFISEPKAVKSISWVVLPMNDSRILPLDYVGYINPSTFDALCKNESFGVEIIWLNTSVIKYGTAIVCDVETIENIVYYQGEYTAAMDMYVNISGVREVYSSSFDGIEKYLSENEVAEDVYFPVGISMAGAPEYSLYVNSEADILPHMFGFVEDPDAKLNLEIIEDYDYESFVVPFDVVGYVNKTTFEKMQKNEQFGLEITWLNEEFFG